MEFFDFLSTNNYSENPTAVGITITVLSSFFLSSLVAITYTWTTESIEKSNNMLQTMVLISIVAAMVMQAIGDSLARGLGMMGALAIIRFRTKLDNPRNMAFVFSSIAIGIACGVYGFTIALIGTLGFCAAAIIFRFAKLGTNEKLTGSLKFQIPLKEIEQIKNLEDMLSKECNSYKLISERYLDINRTKKIKNEEGAITHLMEVPVSKEYHFKFTVSSRQNVDKIALGLNNIKSIDNVRLRLGDNTTLL